ncbi:cardiolipin synthase [Rothia aerolata]|uniref:Cardiolipin synthase n=1 Tax=Rothia aerolata TaxID=1812262 RepID=A0A917IXS2_9MICC|nr:cardiolipin synthase [Rothia aerolata]GGH64805.1 cardiolipin synthase [Rothia aerolata]
MNFLNAAHLPNWLQLTLFIVDIIIRIIAICWLPYNRKPVVALGWLMAIFLVPYVGFIAFLFFGSSHLPKHRRARQRAMNEMIRNTIDYSDDLKAHPVLGQHIKLTEPARVAANLNYRLGALPLVGGNQFTLHKDNHQAMLEMAREIDKAESYVHFEFYITAYNGASEPLWDSIFAAAERGVEVRVLLDHIGSRKYPTFKQLCKRLNESSIKWYLMLPLKFWRGQWQRPDLRNHRKILVVDGRVAFSGSQNAIDASYDLKSNIKKGLLWKDLTFSVTGPVVDELNAVFISDWYSESKELPLSEINTSIPAVNDGQLAQIIPSGPGFETENNLRLINYLIYNAEHRIVICSPYFIPEETLLQALTTAALSNIDVTLIVCEKGDQFLPNMAQRSYYEQLMAAGVKIKQYPGPTVLHSKYMIVDDRYTFIGSSNMDPRSFALNLEVSTFIFDDGMVKELDAVSEEYYAESKNLSYDEWINRPNRVKIVENLCRLWSSLL